MVSKFWLYIEYMFPLLQFFFIISIWFFSFSILSISVQKYETNKMSILVFIHIFVFSKDLHCVLIYKKFFLEAFKFEFVWYYMFLFWKHSSAESYIIWYLISCWILLFIDWSTRRWLQSCMAKRSLRFEDESSWR